MHFNKLSAIQRHGPKSIAGNELYGLAKALLVIKTQDQATFWVQNVISWKIRHKVFLAGTTIDEYGTIRPKHERLIKAENSLVKLINKNLLFTYLDESLEFECQLQIIELKVELTHNYALCYVITTGCPLKDE